MVGGAKVRGFKMEPYILLCALVTCSTFRGALSCQGQDIWRISKLLEDVPNWRGLADQLDIRSNIIATNCALETAHAECYSRELVRSYCNSQPSGNPRIVADDIAKALEEMGHEHQANKMRELQFGGKHGTVEKGKQASGTEPTLTKNLLQESVDVLPSPHSELSSDAGLTENRDSTGSFISDLIQENWTTGLVAVITIFISIGAIRCCARRRYIGGKGTKEYKIMRSNLNSITVALQLNPPASQSLRQKLQEKGWLSITDKLTEEQLVNLVLGRIEHDAKQHGEFVAMLCDIDGMDLIVKKLTLT